MYTYIVFINSVLAVCGCYRLTTTFELIFKKIYTYYNMSRTYNIIIKYISVAHKYNIM